MSQTRKGFLLAVLAGTLAAFASVVGKLASHPVVSDVIEEFTSHIPQIGPFSSQVTYVVRALLIASTFLVNAIMMNSFVRAMDLSNSIVAVVANTGSNFFCSALFGSLFFGEVLTLKWWLGASCILTGLTVLHTFGPEQSKDPPPTQKKVQ